MTVTSQHIGLGPKVDAEQFRKDVTIKEIETLLSEKFVLGSIQEAFDDYYHRCANPDLHKMYDKGQRMRRMLRVVPYALAATVFLLAFGNYFSFGFLINLGYFAAASTLLIWFIYGQESGGTFWPYNEFRFGEVSKAPYESLEAEVIEKILLEQRIQLNDNYALYEISQNQHKDGRKYIYLFVGTDIYPRTDIPESHQRHWKNTLWVKGLRK